MKSGVSRIQQRAESEMEIIRACENDLKAKMAEKKREKARISADLDILNEKIRTAAVEDDKTDFTDRVTQLDKYVKNIDLLIESFRKILNEITDLKLIVQCFYDFKRYCYIVKKIPWKKLPDLICDLDHIEEFYAVVYSLVKDFNYKMKKLRNAEDMYNYLTAHDVDKSVLDVNVSDEL